ncbi:hypothetical protein [Aureispira anguillae]|uniref:Uncharacterized protein n=1 Tax=Aureispira anguillae TaxID=2864201 RepID=A0A915YKE2_9BACT|nr:hypothetical protein [Aureispira anguillae]BDS14700.1 hypothetical protein AsAng_0054810 [Aureispira anguillae]
MKNYYALLLLVIIASQNYSTTALYAQSIFSLQSSGLMLTDWDIQSSDFMPNRTAMREMDFLSHHFLTLSNQRHFSYINPMSSEITKNLYSQNIPLVLFATATRGNTQPISFEKTNLAPYAPTYIPSSSTHWYVGDRLFAVDNSAFFGIEFDSSFAYKNGVIRIGDSSEKALVILVSLNLPKKKLF